MYGVRWGDDVISVRKPKVPWITRGVCVRRSLKIQLVWYNEMGAK